MLKTYINKISIPSTVSYITIFYSHLYHEGYFVEGKHDELPDDTTEFTKSESFRKGIIVVPSNAPAYYDPKNDDNGFGNEYNPIYYFAGSGDYPNPLREFGYYKMGSISPTQFPQKLIDLLKQNYDE